MNSHKTGEIILAPINKRLIIHNPLATFPRFLDQRILLNRRAEY